MMKIKSFLKNIPKKYIVISFIAIVLLILAIILLLVFTKDGKITNSDLEGYKNYYSKSLKLSFDFPIEYKVKKIDNKLYIAKKFKGKEATKPYFIISSATGYKSAQEYLEKKAEASKKEYGNNFTPLSEMLITLIGDKYTAKVTYSNFLPSGLLIENRYAYKKDAKIYQISSISDNNTNSEEVAEISKNIISSLET